MKNPWRALSRWEKALWVAVAACLAAAVFVRPLASVVSRGYAVRSTCCLTNEDLRALPLDPDSDGAALVLEGPRLDPWGRPFRVSHSPMRTFVYSVGPDGEDERGDGDDVVVAPIDTYAVVAWMPAYLAGAATFLVLLFVTARLIRAPRSESLEKELLRALGIAVLPTASATAIVVATVKDLSLFTPLPVLGVAVQPWFAVALCLGIVFFVVALKLRHRASLPLETAEGPSVLPRVRAQVLVPVIALLPLYVAARVIGDRATSWERDRVFVSAQLGFAASIVEVLGKGDVEQRRALVTHPSPGLSEVVMKMSFESVIATVGSDAVPFMIERLADHGHGYDPGGVAWHHLLRFDAQLEQLARRATARPEVFEHVLLARADVIAARVGRRRVLEALAPFLWNKRSGPYDSRWPRYQRRICDLTAEVFARFVGSSQNFWIPDQTKRCTTDEWDDSVNDVPDWWRAEALKPTLPPVGWIVVNGKNLPVHPGLPGVAIRLDSALVWQCTDETGILQVAGPLAPGAHTITLDDVTGKKAFDVPVTVPPEGEAWIDVDFATGVVKVTNAEAK